MPYELLSRDALREIDFSEILTSKKGQKYIEIRFAGNTPIFQLSAKPLYSPFHAGVYGDTNHNATRLNLELNLDDDTQEMLETLDTYFEAQLQTLAPGKQYHKLVQRTGDYPARVRCKVNTTGPQAARFWSTDQSPLGNVRNVDTACKNITCCVCVSKVWIMGISAGVTLELRAAVLDHGTIPSDVFPL